MTAVSSRQTLGASSQITTTLKDIEESMALPQPVRNLIMAYAGRPDLLNAQSGQLILDAWKGNELISRFTVLVSKKTPVFEQIRRIHSAVAHLADTSQISKLTLQLRTNGMAPLALAPVLEAARKCKLLGALDHALVVIYQQIEKLIPREKITLIKKPTGDSVQAWMLKNQTFLSETITHLDLSSSGLQVLPMELTLCKNLEGLDLKENELETFPDFCADFARLDVLDLSYNHLSVLPDFVCDYPKLALLDVSYNKLKNLPDRIGNLPLTHLFLKGTDITTLPASCAQLTKLSSDSIDDTVQELLRDLQLNEHFEFTGMDTSEL